MPTYNRRKFVPQAIEFFRRQDYEKRELVIVDDGTDSVEDLVEGEPRARYLRLPARKSVGVKRNLACDAAAGDIIVHWDDDDWMASWRLSYQVESLLKGPADICGVDRMMYYDPVANEAWHYVFPDVFPGIQPWIAGGSFCYRKALWRHNPFKDHNEGEDNSFLWGMPMNILKLPRTDFYIAIVHSGNTSTKETESGLYSACSAEYVEAIVEKDMLFYQQLRA